MRRRYRKTARSLPWAMIPVIIAAGLTFIAFSSPSRSASSLELAVVTALTGDGADWGQTELNAVKLAIMDAEAAHVVEKGVVHLETENAPAEDVGAAVTAYRRAVATGAPYAVIGPTWDDAAAAIAPISTDLKTVTIAPDASSAVQKGHVYPFYFSMFSPEAPEMAVLAGYLARTGAKRAAIVFNQDPFSQQFHDAFAAAAKKAGLAIIGEFPIADPDARDFRGIIARLQALKPDVVYIEMTSTGAKGPFMRQAHDQGLKARVVSSSTTDTASLLKEYGDALDGLTFAAPIETPARRALAARYQKAFGAPPTAPSAPSAYDAARILITAFRAGVAPGEPLKDYLLGLTHIDGISAKGMRFTPEGRITWPEEAYEIRQIQAGAVHVVPTR
ncbi:MAG: ABC transporter substrate-binding protein [Alphaproteobacteria bacterium]